jgi:hypothetical protein
VLCSGPVDIARLALGLVLGLGLALGLGSGQARARREGGGDAGNGEDTRRPRGTGDGESKGQRLGGDRGSKPCKIQNPEFPEHRTQLPWELAAAHSSPGWELAHLLARIHMPAMNCGARVARGWAGRRGQGGHTVRADWKVTRFRVLKVWFLAGDGW